MAENDAARIQAALGVLGWSTDPVAEHLGIKKRKVRRWKSGKESCPPKIIEWLEASAAKAQAGADMSDISAAGFPGGWRK